MSTSYQLGNPFTVTSPEDISAREMMDLFVDVFSDFPKINRVGHVILQGPRGSGKSMIFRYMKNDCQKAATKCKLNKLPFFSVYFGIRNSQLNLTELMRLDQKYASVLLNEHFMVMSLAEATFNELAEICGDLRRSAHLDEAKAYAASVIDSLVNYGWKGDASSVTSQETVSAYFRALAGLFTNLFREVIQYVKNLAFRQDVLVYQGILCGYMDFLYPLLCGLKNLSFLPKGPVYLLIDDADNLNLTQTKILNTWVSTRTSSNVSLKISSQLRYKTYHTVQDNSIESPHDYSEVNIQTIYTAETVRTSYVDMVRQAIAKRLSKVCSNVTPEEFFVEDVEQEKQIKEIALDYRRRWATEGRGARPSDDAIRYARPDYIRNLGGTRKSTSHYSYAGFLQLVHLSSGIIRYFLESAAFMYAEMEAQSPERKVALIPDHIQDKIARQQANEYLFKDLGKIYDDPSVDITSRELIPKLRNLIDALGGTFKKILNSDRSERRVFSIAFSNDPSEEVRHVLKLGVELGYFHESTIGNKSGTGRTQLYILNRRLAPVYNLDPTSFAGYLFVTSEIVEQAIHNPQALLRRVDTQNIDELFEQRQLSLF